MPLSFLRPATRAYSDAELITLLSEDVAQLEEGLTLLTKDYPCPAGQIDLLAQDRFQRLVIVEAKSATSDAALSPALAYLAWVDDNKPRIASQFGCEVTDHESRLIFLAPSYSGALRRAAGYLQHRGLDVLLLEYSVYGIDASRDGVMLREAGTDPVVRVTRPPAWEDHLARLQHPGLRDLATRTYEELTELGLAAEVTPQCARFSVGPAILAWLYPRGTVFDLNYWPGRHPWVVNHIADQATLNAVLDTIREGCVKWVGERSEAG